MPLTDALKKMCENEAFRFYQYGTIDMLDTITNESLVAHYNEIMTGSPIDIVVVGELNFEKKQEN